MTKQLRGGYGPQVYKEQNGYGKIFNFLCGFKLIKRC